MDFFDKLGRKASETYQVTKEKTVKFSEEVKLKMKSSSLRNEIEDLYGEIGEMVFRQYKNNVYEQSSEIEKKCQDVSNKFDEISKIEDNILKIRKVKKCIECQTEIDINAEYCSKCGKPQPENCCNTTVEEHNDNDMKDAEVTEINDMNDNNN